MIENSTSLIVATYNWPEALKLCLLSIQQQSVLPKEVIIADDGSRDDTKELIASFQLTFPVPLIHVWQEDSGFRLAEIRNKAFARASYDYLIQIDGDVFLHEDFIKDHLKAAKPNTLLQGSRVMLGADFSKKLLAGQKPDFSFLATDTQRLENALRIPMLSTYLLNRYKNRFPVYFARGANMSFWKKDILAVNGYNENYEGWGHEDSDLTLRMMNNGVKKSVIKFSAIIYHLYHPENKNSEQEEKNKLILENTKQNHVVWVENGVSQYLK